MNLEKILEKFSIISGITSPEEIAPWITVCEDAYIDIKTNLKDDVDLEKHSRRLNSAAASLAFYRYVLYQASSGAHTFTAGEIRIRTDIKTSVKLAHNVWLDAKRGIADLLKDEEFVFERIV